MADRNHVDATVTISYGKVSLTRHLTAIGESSTADLIQSVMDALTKKVVAMARADADT